MCFKKKDLDGKKKYKLLLPARLAFHDVHIIKIIFILLIFFE
jgi:hypothetical protein